MFYFLFIAALAFEQKNKHDNTNAIVIKNGTVNVMIWVTIILTKDGNDDDDNDDNGGVYRIKRIYILMS